MGYAAIRMIIHTTNVMAHVLATCCLRQSGTLSSLVFGLALYER
jgi:hypothetical protein